MPSAHWEKQRRALKESSHTMSVAEFEHGMSFINTKALAEEQRALNVAMQDETQLSLTVEGIEQTLTETLENLRRQVKDAVDRKVGAKELMATRETIQRIINNATGDGDKVPGLLTSVDTGYERVDEVREDPGKSMDELYLKFPGLSDTRDRLNSNDRESASARRQALSRGRK